MNRLASLALGGVVLASFFDNFSQFPIVAPYARSLGAGPEVIGVVVAAYSATNLGGNVVAGYLIDRFGRKRLLIGGLLAAACAVLLYAVAQTPGQLVLVRAVHGLAAAVLAPAAFTLMGDIFPRERRGQAMGVNGALIALAAMLAPALSGVVRDQLGFAAVFLVVSALLVLAALTTSLLVRETHRPSSENGPSLSSRLGLLARKPLLLAYASAVALTFGMGTLVTYLPLRLADLGYRASQTGVVFSAFAVVALLIMVSPLSRAGDRASRFGPIGLGLTLVGASLALLSIGQQLAAVFACMGLYGLGFGLIFPAVNAQVADATVPSERGTAFGIFYAFYSVGVVVGSLVSGLVAGQATASPFDPFLLAGLLSLAVGPAVLLLGRSAAPSAVVSAVVERD